MERRSPDRHRDLLDPRRPRRPQSYGAPVSRPALAASPAGGVSLWSAGLQTGTATCSTRADQDGRSRMERPSPGRHSPPPRPAASVYGAPVSRPAPRPARPAPTETAAVVWSARLQAGTRRLPGRRRQFMERRSPDRHRDLLDPRRPRRPQSYGAPVSRPALAASPAGGVSLWSAGLQTGTATCSTRADQDGRSRMERPSPGRHERQDQARYLCRSGERRSIGTGREGRSVPLWRAALHRHRSGRTLGAALESGAP